MQDKKRYSKTKIFLFLIFALLGIVLIAQVVRVIQESITSINKRSVELKCIDLNFQIKDISYKNNKLVFELLSKDYDTNISKVTVVSEKQDFVKDITPTLKGGESYFLSFNNISIGNVIYIYINDCKDNGIEKEI